MTIGVEQAPRPWWPALGWFAAGALAGIAISFAILNRSEHEQRGSTLTLTGAGASFPYPLYRRWFAAYGDSTGVRVNYYSVGSGGGIMALLQGDVDFGASDRPLRASEISEMPCGEPMAIPTAVGAVALAYHLPPLSQPLHLDDTTIAAIFGGAVKQWDDPRIRALNPGVALPAIPVRVVHRSDASGTTAVFLRFLSRHTSAWASSADDAVTRWPVGTAATGNEGVAAEVQVTIGAIGYVEASYARQLRLPIAAVRNATGAFVLPSSAAVSAAATSVFRGARADTVRSLLGATDSEAYPIASLTWLLIPPQARDTLRANAVLDFARWALARPSADLVALDFAPLPQAATAHYQETLRGKTTALCPARPILPRPGM